MTDVTLDAVELHALARDPHAPAPAAFASANAKVDETKVAHQDAVWARHDLIREARQLGVPWAALSRWTGLNRRSLDRIVHDR